MTLNEDTIIYINTNPEKLDINLIQGSMTVDTMNRKKSEVEKINIVHGDEVIRLQKSLISLGKKNSNSALQLELKDGEAKLSKADRDYALRKGSTVISKKDFLQELEIQSVNTEAERQTLFQSFSDRQAEKGSINGVQIVKSGDQFLVFGQNEKGTFLEASTDRFSVLGKEVSRPDELKDRSRILFAALASLGMNSLKNVRTDDRSASSWTDLEIISKGKEKRKYDIVKRSAVFPGWGQVYSESAYSIQRGRFRGYSIMTLSALLFGTYIFYAGQAESQKKHFNQFASNGILFSAAAGDSLYSVESAYNLYIINQLTEKEQTFSRAGNSANAALGLIAFVYALQLADAFRIQKQELPRLSFQTGRTQGQGAESFYSLSAQFSF